MPPTTRFTYDLDRLLFRDARSGRFVPSDKVFGEVNKVIGVSERRITMLAEQARAKTISIETFHSRMRSEVKTLHVALGMAANGGLKQMNPQRWGAVGGRIKREFGYLEGFRKDLTSGRVPLTSAVVRSRARSYTGNARLEYWATVNTRLKLNNVQAVGMRRLGGVQTEHCPGCMSSANEWMPIDKLPPIGVMQCKWFCRCSVKHKIVRMAVPLNDRQAAALERRVPEADGPGGGLAANELSVRERQLLDRIALGPLKQVDLNNAERHLAAKLAERGQLVKEKIDGKFVYRIAAEGPVTPPVVTPVVVPLPPVAPTPGPLIQPYGQLTARQLEVFQKITTSPTAITIRELTPAEAKIANLLVRMGELERHGPYTPFIRTPQLPGYIRPQIVPVQTVADLSSKERAAMRIVLKYRGAVNDKGVEAMPERMMQFVDRVRTSYHSQLRRNQFTPKELTKNTMDQLVKRGLVEQVQEFPDNTYLYRATMREADFNKYLRSIPAGPLPKEFKTIKEAVDWAERKYSWIGFDFTGFDLKSADATVREFDRLATKYPAVARRLKYLGSQRDQLKVKAYMTFEPSRFKGAYGHAFMAQDGQAIGLNAAWFKDYESLTSALLSDAATGWHPTGAATPESVLTHEFGHMLDAWLRRVHMVAADAIDDTRFTVSNLTYQFHQSNYEANGAMYARAYKAGMPHSTMPSRYALKNEKEAWAEGFTAIEWTPQQYWTDYVKAQKALLDWVGDETTHAISGLTLANVPDAALRRSVMDMLEARLQGANLTVVRTVLEEIK